MWHKNSYQNKMHDSVLYAPYGEKYYDSVTTDTDPVKKRWSFAASLV